MSRLRQYFIAGLLVLLPMVVTGWLLLWLIGMLDGIFAGVLNGFDHLVPELRRATDALRRVPGLGLVLVLITVVTVGVLTTNILGQWWLRQWERMVARIPFVSGIYSSVKQVSETLLSGTGQAFSKAVLIQYPRKGLWTIAFLTGTPGGEVVSHLPPDCISVYVPTTPNPTSGFFLMVPRSDITELHMNVDEAIKYVVSMGVVAPAPHGVIVVSETPKKEPPENSGADLSSSC